MNSGSTTSYLATDQLGSVIAASGSDGSLQGAWSYSAFGQREATQPSVEMPLGYTGALWLSTTGVAGPSVWHLSARDYDPASGRFLQRDPTTTTASTCSAASSQPAYAYVGNRPTTMVDPSGMVADTPGSNGMVADTPGAWGAPTLAFMPLDPYFNIGEALQNLADKLAVGCGTRLAIATNRLHEIQHTLLVHHVNDDVYIVGQLYSDALWIFTGWAVGGHPRGAGTPEWVELMEACPQLAMSSMQELWKKGLTL